MDARQQRTGVISERSVIDDIAYQQSIVRTRIFDYERKLAPETVQVARPEDVLPHTVPADYFKPPPDQHYQIFVPPPELGVTHLRIALPPPAPITIAPWNPQPITPILLDTVKEQEKVAYNPIAATITNEQAKMAEGIKSTIATTTVKEGVLGRVAVHSVGFGLPEKATELPLSVKMTSDLPEAINITKGVPQEALLTKELPGSFVLILLDRIFLFINSIGKKK